MTVAGKETRFSRLPNSLRETKTPSMNQADVRIRSLEDTDIGEITALDETIGGRYRPEIWERRIGYYIRRDPEASVVAESGGRVVGFMLGEVRAGEFGLEEPTGWIEVMGVDPGFRGQRIGRRLGERMLDHFRARGAVRVRTLVGEGMEEIAAFFTALGFEPAPLKPFVLNL
jgi:ribosomal protein S18 acetylase RimI-like enzyme